MFNYVFLIVLCFMFVLYCLRLGIEFSRLMAHYKCILLLLLYYYYYYPLKIAELLSTKESRKLLSTELTYTGLQFDKNHRMNSRNDSRSRHMRIYFSHLL